MRDPQVEASMVGWSSSITKGNGGRKISWSTWLRRAMVCWDKCQVKDKSVLTDQGSSKEVGGYWP